MAGFGSGEAALARFLLQRLVIVREKENRHLFQTKDGIAGGGVIFGIDSERFAVQGPPRVRDVTVRDDAVIDDVPVFELFRRHAFEIEGLLRDQQTGTRYDFGFCKALWVKKSAVAGDGVVLGRIGSK